MTPPRAKCSGRLYHIQAPDSGAILGRGAFDVKAAFRIVCSHQKLQFQVYLNAFLRWSSVFLHVCCMPNQKFSSRHANACLNAGYLHEKRRKWQPGLGVNQFMKSAPGGQLHAKAENDFISLLKQSKSKKLQKRVVSLGSLGMFHGRQLHLFIAACLVHSNSHPLFE